MKLNTRWSKRLAGISLCVLASHLSQAQIHAPEYPENKWLITAEEQYQHGFYTLAAQSAQYFLHTHIGNTYPVAENETDKALFYYTVSCIKLDQHGCIDTALNYIATTPNPVYRERTAFALAQYYFQRNDFASAIPYYEMAGIANLSNLEIADKNFELAYCYFNNQQFDKATPLFSSIKELTTGKYYSAGNYYYGLLSYNINNYEDALKSFDRIKDEPQYRAIVPYYIAEIYYFTGKRNEALTLVKDLIARKEKSYYDNELHLLAAQCLFEQQQFEEALPYFEYYYNHTDKIRKEDLYEMAYCYYRTQNWQQATDKFKLLSNTHDSLGQTAMYLLGDCYLKADDKKSARNAFGICADMPFNAAQQEASMILYAKLSYEMGYNDVAAAQLKNLLANYPTSKYKDEAKTLLSDLLIKTSDYKEAYENMSSVEERYESYWRVYQKVTFGYAVKQFEDGNLTMADSLFALSLQKPEDATYTAAAYFWRGELAYRLRHYDNTIAFSQSFLDYKSRAINLQNISPGATAQRAYINMGYAAMQLDKYKDAQSYFANARQGHINNDTATDMVATLREADAVFMQKDYNRAATLYDQVIASNNADADYARYQKSILLGLEGNNSDKVTLLQTLINKKPASVYANKARYELALTYIESNRYQDAVSLLQPLTTAPDLAPKAWMRMGFAYQQLNNTDKAIDAYKHVVTDYPTADERPAALDALKSIYIQSNQPAAYTKLLKDYNLPSADSASIDSTYYSAAETQFASSNWNAAVQAMSNYLQQFPNGAFTTKAHYYRAESNYQLKHDKEALADYDSVLATPWSEFSENSARKAATISFENGDYANANKYYGQLRNVAMGKDNLQTAYNGLMQTSFKTEQYEAAQKYADTLLSLPDVSATVVTNAQLYKAKALQHFGNNDSALVIYQQLENSKNGAVAAEARYHISEIYLAQNKLKDAETAANNTISKSGGYDYWIVKSYLLLSDVLVQEKDYFNAKATLQSIVKHTNIPELKQQATQKLDAVKALEKQNSKLSEE